MNVCHNFRPAPELRCIINYKSQLRQIISSIFLIFFLSTSTALNALISVNKIYAGFSDQINSRDALANIQTIDGISFLCWNFIHVI